MAIVPVTQICSSMLPLIFIGSIFFGVFKLALLAVGVYLVLTLFQLITLPVEFDASRRAKIILQQMGIIRAGEEAAGVNKVLDAAALTYVAAFVASLGTLLYYVLMLTGNRSDETKAPEQAGRPDHCRFRQQLPEPEVQADLKSFSHFGCYGLTAITCVVAEVPERFAPSRRSNRRS